LLLFEGIWSAHLDSAVGALVLVAALRLSAASFAFAVALKIIPIVSAPAFFLNSSRRTRCIAIVAAILNVPLIPFIVTGPLMPGLHDYATRWIFNTPAYSAAFEVARHLPLKSTWTAIKDPLHLEVLSPFVYAHVYDDFIARSILGIAILGIVIWRRRFPLDCIGALLLLSPAVHPWYWLTLAPLALVQRSRWLWLAAAAPCSYLLYGGTSEWVVWGLCYALPIGVIARLRTSTTAS
jgi:hypothetical protein